MKILWITPWFGNYRIPVYEHLQRLSGNNFFLLCSAEDTSELVQQKLIDHLGDNVKILEKGKKYTLRRKDDYSNFANSKIVLKWQPGLWKSVKEIKPDVIITEGFGGWAPVGILYKILHRKKLCMFYERTSYVERKSPWYKTMYRSFIGKTVDYFLINGIETEQYLDNKLKLVKKPKVKGCMVADSKGLADAVRNFSEKDRICLKNKFSISKGHTFLFVGQMVARKGIDRLLTAWVKHIIKYPDDHLLVIGDGILLNECKTIYSKEKSIHILGSISYSEIHKYYSICDVFIMPTLEDNWCLVLPEAMACSKAVACSIYNGGTVELIKDGFNGYSFDPLDMQSIIEVLSKFHAPNLSLDIMGKRSADIEKAFSPELAAQKIFYACNCVFDN